MSCPHVDIVSRGRKFRSDFLPPLIPSQSRGATVDESIRVLARGRHFAIAIARVYSGPQDRNRKLLCYFVPTGKSIAHTVRDRGGVEGEATVGGIRRGRRVKDNLLSMKNMGINEGDGGYSEDRSVSRERE